MKRSTTTQIGQDLTQATSKMTGTPAGLNQALAQNSRIDALEEEVFRLTWLLDQHQKLLDKLSLVLEKYANIVDKLVPPRHRSETECSTPRTAKGLLKTH